MLCFFSVLDSFGIGLGDEISAVNKKTVEEIISVAIYAGIRSYNFEHKINNYVEQKQVQQWLDDSIITRKHFKDIYALWLDFMQEFNDRNKKKQVTENH